MSFYAPPPSCRSFQAALAPFLQDDGLPFADVLTAQDIHDACAAEHVCFGQGEHALYTPAVTLWAFLAQGINTQLSMVVLMASCVSTAIKTTVLVLIAVVPREYAGHVR